MKKVILLTAAFLGIAGLCAAQETGPEAKKYSLNVEDAVKLALENNVSIARQQITLDAAKRSKDHSWNSVSPTLSLGASSSVPVDALSDNSSNYAASFGVSATASINFTANLYTSIQSAKLSYEQNQISFDDAVRSVELSVRQSYYTLIYEKENIALQEENLKIAKTQYENNLEKYNLGRLSEIDALSAEVNYKGKIPTVESARTTYQNDLASFKQVLGLMVRDELELTGSLSDVLYLDEISVDAKDACSSTVKALELKLDAAKNSVLDKRFSAYAPSVNASLKLNDGNWYAGYDGTAPEAKKSTSISLTATVPLDGYLPWSTKNDAIDTAKDSVKDYELQLDNAKKDLKRSVDSSLRTIAQSQESIKYKQANITLAQKTYDMTLEAYNRGTKDLLTLQNANTTLLNAKVTLNQEILTLEKAVLTLENTTGMKFGTLNGDKK